MPWVKEPSTNASTTTTTSAPLDTCTTEAQFRKYMDLFSEVTTLSENSVAERTGCLPNCNRMEFKAIIISSSAMKDVSVSQLGAFLYYPSGRYVQKKYYYQYNWNDFFADVGGYLGLLLGESLLSFYDMMKSVGKRVI